MVEERGIEASMTENDIKEHIEMVKNEIRKVLTWFVLFPVDQLGDPACLSEAKTHLDFILVLNLYNLYSLPSFYFIVLISDTIPVL